MKCLNGLCIFSLVILTYSMIATRIAVSQEVDTRLANYDINPHIRFQDRQQAEDRRNLLVRAIWREGLPTTRPTVTEKLSAPEEVAKVNQSLISRVDQYRMNVSNMDFVALSYVMYPSKPVTSPPRLAIVQAGHMPEGKDHYLDAGLSQTIERLLENGFIVAATQMPLVGWNKHSSGTLPNGLTFVVNRRGTAGHDELFGKVEGIIGGQTMAFFLEPVVQVTNELLARHPNKNGVLMIGLSGGGWTTQFSSALDPRIRCSIPVAGALPLYARPFSRGSKGDSEQEYAPILGEEDTNGDGILDRPTGVCSWLEIFALGALSPVDGPSRRQVQVVNFEDSCCFNGPVYQTYSDRLTKKVAGIGGGSWDVYVDRSHKDHMISTPQLDNVLMPMIKVLETP